MIIQIQTKKLGRGFNQPWEIYGEWRGQRLPKYAQAIYRELKLEGCVDARIITSSEDTFIGDKNA